MINKCMPGKPATETDHLPAEKQTRIITKYTGVYMDSGKKRILLAEDNTINQKVALLMLKKYDQSIDIASNGRIAVEKFLHHDYDLVLMDLHMPELDGFEATIQIREIELSEKRVKKVKIYAMTASSITDESEKCYAVGMDGYISKPFKAEEVISVLA